jgi:hypothetical protein
VRGKHSISERSLLQLAQKLNMEPNELREWAGLSKNGPLLPQLLGVLEWVHRVASQSLTRLTSGAICPCCSGELLQDSSQWWKNSNCSLGTNEIAFIERLLSVVMTGAVLCKWVASSKKQTDKVWQDFSQVWHCREHPVGSWLKLVTRSYGKTTFKDLYIALPQGNGADVFNYERLLKWSAGADLPPRDKVDLMVAPLLNKAELLAWYRLALHLALAMDFLAAASREPLPAGKERELIHARLRHLRQNIGLAYELREGISQLKPIKSDKAG